MRQFKIEVVDIIRPKDDLSINIIIGMSHFIKTIEDLYEALVTSVPGIKFGIAFCEASGVKKIRADGTDKDLIDLAVKNAKKLKAGHSFIIILKDCFPINVLNRIKLTAEVCNIFCATANPVQVVIIETKQGRGIMGVIDGEASSQLENEADIDDRKNFLRKIGYKF